MKKAIKAIGLCCAAIIIIVGVWMALSPKTLDFRGTVTEIEKTEHTTTLKLSTQSIGTSYLVVADAKTPVGPCHKDDPAIHLEDIKIGDTIEGNYDGSATNNQAKFITVWCSNGANR